MRALVLEQAGQPPALAIKEVPAPDPAPGEALVRVAACGFCRHDLLAMTGVLRRGVPPGIILGHEIAGVVEKLGEGVTTVAPGDRVVSLLTSACGRCDRCQQGREHRCRRAEGIGHGRPGGLAEHVALSEHSLVAIPDSLALQEACLLACPIGVVAQAIEEVAALRPGETVLVTGAGGGLGAHAIQVAKALGGRVLAVTSSPQKAQRLAELGAAEVLEVGDLDFGELALALTEDQGVDVAVDTVGSPLFSSVWRSLAQYGRMVLLGEVAGRPVALNPAEVIFKDARISGSSGVSRRGVARAMELVSQGAVTPVVDRVLTLEEAPTALHLMVEGQLLGRIVFTPGGAH